MMDIERTVAEARALATENQALRSDARTRARLLWQLIEERDNWKRCQADMARQLESAKAEVKTAHAVAECYRHQAVVSKLEKLDAARRLAARPGPTSLHATEVIEQQATRR
ncbi:hypothetical protein [Variovorax sp. OV329]|uniref:hypothetical protein n=1 Tax=Variovorax sp. OV329 TaxID=1882825 RepID=UPI0008E3B60B|nr:hypothetical protein [Variovorax sp. OV329]SFM91983.1 hypothetical protein SAMN05444747_11131 [Variovorax sp. OV329]